MSAVTVAVDIAAPAATTWAMLTDWPRQGEWMPLTLVEVVAGDGQGIGTELRARSGVGPLGFTDPMVIDVWQPPYRCEVVHRGSLVTGRGIFLVEDRPGDASRFTWSELLESTGVRRFLDPPGALASRAMLTYAVRRFGRLVEREAAAGRP